MAKPEGLEVRIGERRGVPTLYVDGEPVLAMAYMSYNPIERHMRSFAEAGYRMFSVACYFAGRGINSDSGIGPFRSGIWKGPGRIDISEVEADLDRVLRVRPRDALVILRVCLEAPVWWDDLHPEELLRLHDGTPIRQSFASEVWRSEAGEVLEELIERLEASPYRNHIIAYQVAAGRTEEWAYHGSTQGRLPDYSLCAQRAFRRWLRGRYGTDGALQAAWRDEGAAIERASIPEAAARRASAEHRFRDPGRERHVIDFYRFHAELVADTILYFARRAKRACKGRALVGAFYGYTYEMPSIDTGHHAVRKLLDADEIDYLCSPNSYLGGRKIGLDWPFFGPTGSVRLHNKVWLTESDTRTHLTKPLSQSWPEVAPKEGRRYEGGLFAGPARSEDALAMLRANLARALTHGVGTWWFDMWGGWFDSPEYMAFMKSAARLAERDLWGPPAAEVAVIVSEESAFFGPWRHELTAQLVNAQRVELGFLGAPYDVFLLEDLADPRTHGYKLYIFLNGWYVPQALREQVHKLRRQGKSMVWLHGAGFFDETGGSLARARELTGWPLVRLESDGRWQVRLEGGDPLLEGCQPGSVYGVALPQGGECFAVVGDELGPEARVLGRLEGLGAPGLAVRREPVMAAPGQAPESLSVYSAAPRLPAALLRNAAVEVGVHRYTDGAADVVYAGGRLLGVLTMEPGPRTIRLPRPARLVDAFSGATAGAGAEIRLELPPGTSMWILEDP